MRHTPELHFAFDDAEMRAARIEELLSQEAAAVREREQNAQERNGAGSEDADEKS
jgi:hypothetical protein